MPQYTFTLKMTTPFAKMFENLQYSMLFSPKHRSYTLRASYKNPRTEVVESVSNSVEPNASK
jgi:hypothetical protein